MDPSGRTKAKTLLRVVAKVFFATAAFAFVFGGELIHAVRGTDRMLAEIRVSL